MLIMVMMTMMMISWEIYTDRLMNVLAVLLEAIAIVSLLIHTAVILFLVPVQNTRA